MEIQVHKSYDRGHADYGWLNANYSFSFAQYYNPSRIHFGNLRVVNDDVIAAGTGFSKHPHDNMEIITIPFKGVLEHTDSMGHRQTISANEVQVMSAGTGVFHTESNASKTEPVNLMQIWIFPEKKNIQPRYNQKEFDPQLAQNEWQLLVGRDGEGAPLQINQDARISRIFLEEGREVEYTNKKTFNGNFVFVVEGEIKIGNELGEKRDSIEIKKEEKFTVKALKDSYLINIEV